MRIVNAVKPVLIACFALLMSCAVESVEGTLVKTHAEFERAVKQAKPGDTIVLANGVWRDVELLFTGVGTEQAPITLSAETKGKVFISGRSNLRLAGEYLVVSGLVFKEGYTPTDAVISFRKNSKTLANHSRVTEVVIDNFNNPERTETDYWVAMYGKNNRFDHNHLEGKRNRGVTMAVRLNTEASQENHHRIDHNYFGPRQILGSNGGETLRIGTSHYSLSDSFTVVENNYFDRCDGELEIISNKSGGNVFRGNVFFESRGTLTMRHGNGNTIESNVFLGNGVDHTGGIRVINADQTVRNNYMEGLAGYRFGGALVVMNGVPNSPINRYHQVANARIENNSLIHSDHIQLAAGSDQERSAVPVNSHFSGNLIVSDSGNDVFTVYDDVSGIRFSNNAQAPLDAFSAAQGFATGEAALRRAENGLLYPQTEALVTYGVDLTITPIKKSQTGTSWYAKPERGSKFSGGKRYLVKAEAGELAKAVATASAGDVLVLAKGKHVVSRIVAIDKPLTIESVSIDEQASIVFERSTLFELKDGGSLALRKLAISGELAPDSAGNAVIRTQPMSMLVNYDLILDAVTVSNLDINHSFNVLSVAKSSFANQIVLKDSVFSNISGAVLKLDAETDDYGIYNAEYVDISGSRFHDIQGAVISFYRGGTDESTFGPHFSFANNHLDAVGKGKRNKSKAAIHLHGVQVTDVSANRIDSSLPIRIVHTVGEPVSHIYNNRFTNTAAPTVVELHSGLANTAHIRDNQFTEVQR